MEKLNLNSNGRIIIWEEEDTWSYNDIYEDL